MNTDRPGAWGVDSACRRVSVPSDRIVAVGFLTQNDLKVLGEGFDRMFPVDDAAGFDDLLAKLDGIAAIPHRGSINQPLQRD